MSSNMKSNFSRYQSFHFPIKEVKNKKRKQLRCENTPLKKYWHTYTLGRLPSPYTFSHIFGVLRLPPPSERMYFLNGPKNLRLFSKHNIRFNLGKS